MPRLLRAEDVLNRTFTQTQFREGYDEREVDELLDDVVATLRRHEGGGSGGAFRMTSHGLGSARFTVTKFRRGYDRAEIDAFLAEVVQTLRRHERGGHDPVPDGPVPGGPAPAPRAPTSRPASTSAVVEPRSWGARALRALRGDKG